MTRRKKPRVLVPHRPPSRYGNTQARIGITVAPALSTERHDLDYTGEPVTSLQTVPYDENLLERSLTQWQSGDWDSLKKMKRGNLQDHPHRASLALLAAAAHQAHGNTTETRQFIKLAIDWGCSKQLVTQILISGAHNTLGRAAAAAGQEHRAIKHFEASIGIAMPHCDIPLMGQSRFIRESAKLGLLAQAAHLMTKELAALKYDSSPNKTRMHIFESELELLHQELSLAQQRQQLFLNFNACSSLTEPMSQAMYVENLGKKSVSQLGQDLWVLEKTAYKRNGFFVEFGATDGVLLSNSWLLEKGFGWQGICAEPNPNFFEKLKRNRACIISNAYIGRETGKEIDFILADVYGGSKEFADCDLQKAKRDFYAAAGHVATFVSISLNDFLEQHNAPHRIDYISIDTEGSEYDLLSSFPFKKWNIRLFTIEHNWTEQREKIRILLESHGYHRKEQQWDDWYEKIEVDAD